MPLETANNAFELNASNPLPSDPIKNADAHLRMIKRILKGGFQGQFTALTSVRALNSDDGTWFYYNNGMYLVLASPLAESLPNIIKLNNNKIALRFAIYSIGRDILLPTSSSQQRLPAVKKVTITASSFDTAAANSAFAGTPIPGDVVIMLGNQYSESRIFNSSWVTMDDTLYGYQSVIGSLSALSLMSPLGLFDTIRSQKIELVSPQFVEVSSSQAFGPDNLRYWFGANSGILDGNGNIAYNSLSRANATEWKSMTAGSTNGSTTPVDGGAVLDNLNMGASYTCEADSYQGQPANENARIVVGVDGRFAILSLGDVVSGSPVTAPWVTTPSASTGSLYEVMFEQLGGTAVAGLLGSYQAISQARQVSLSVSRSTVGSSNVSASIRISIRKIGDAVSVKTRTVSLTAVATVYSGAIP